MNVNIKQHVAEFLARQGDDATDESIIETIRAAKAVWSGDEDERRWWTDCLTVVEVDGMLIGFGDAITTGDDSPEDKGWEFDPNTICEVAAETKTITIYRPA